MKNNDMKSYKINKRGSDFISLRKKQLRQTILFFPFFLILILLAGIVKLGITVCSLVFLIMILPLLLLALYSAALKPQKVIKNLIVKIEISNNIIILETETLKFKFTNYKKQNNLRFFNQIFSEYYIIKNDNIAYYLISDFFDDFTFLEISNGLSKENKPE